MKSIQLACAAAVLGAVSHAVPAQDAPDHILVNGKIATVDDLFSIREAVALRGERIVAVGSNAAIEALADASTRRSDLGGRTVIPGLIDNHNHVVRATEYWPNEARLDGVASRADALQLLEAKARTLSEGQWLMSLGGWSEAQFAGDRSDFTLAELDAVAPRPARVHPVGLRPRVRQHRLVRGHGDRARRLGARARRGDRSRGPRGARRRRSHHRSSQRRLSHGRARAAALPPPSPANSRCRPSSPPSATSTASG